MCPGIKPCESASERLDKQFSVREKTLINSGYLIFPTRRRPDGPRHIHYLVRIEIQAGNSVVALRF